MKNGGGNLIDKSVFFAPYNNFDDEVDLCVHFLEDPPQNKLILKIRFFWNGENFNLLSLAHVPATDLIRYTF